jgi:hypothetical protein
VIGRGVHGACCVAREGRSAVRIRTALRIRIARTGAARSGARRARGGARGGGGVQHAIGGLGRPAAARTRRRRTSGGAVSASSTLGTCEREPGVLIASLVYLEWVQAGCKARATEPCARHPRRPRRAERRRGALGPADVAEHAANLLHRGQRQPGRGGLLTRVIKLDVTLLVRC